ncbi:hypothetical protein D3C74_395720 [compost metagenome]
MIASDWTLTTLARPRARNIAASEAMKGCMSKYWTITPISRPNVVPISTPRTRTTGSGAPTIRSLATTRPTRATTAPTDRSIPPVMITNVMPIARTIRYELSTSRLEKSRMLRKSRRSVL